MEGSRYLGVAAVLALTACAGRTEVLDDPLAPPLFVRQVLKPDAPQCVVYAEPEWTSLLGGVLDTAFRKDYQAALLFGNELTGPHAHDAIAVDRADVVVVGETGAELDRFSQTVAGFAAPAAGGEPGWGVASAFLIRDAVFGTAPTTEASLVARVVLSGTTLDGAPVKSPAFSFPIAVCTGCLVDYPLEADDPAMPGYQCTAVDSATNIDEPCRRGQDDLVDCRLCGGMPLVPGAPLSGAQGASGAGGSTGMHFCSVATALKACAAG